MSIATYDTASAVRAETSAAPARKRAEIKRPGLLTRLYVGFMDARRRQAFAELKRHGVMLPSELEQAGWKLSERSEDSLPFRR